MVIAPCDQHNLSLRNAKGIQISFRGKATIGEGFETEDEAVQAMNQFLDDNPSEKINCHFIFEEDDRWLICSGHVEVTAPCC